MEVEGFGGASAARLRWARGLSPRPCTSRAIRSLIVQNAVSHNEGLGPNWQAWMQKNQPRLLVIWGRHDPSFDISEPEAYRREVHRTALSLQRLLTR
jgi:hypothetical protein